MIKIIDSYLVYWKHLTGANIMSTKFKIINEQFFKRSNELYHDFELSVRSMIITLFK